MKTANLPQRWNRSKALKLRGLIEKANLCGCGSNAHMVCILELLERGEDHDAKGSYYGEENSPTAPWVEFGAKVMDSWGWTEHGTGIGWAWLTEEGSLVLEFLREFGLNDSEYPQWVYEFGWEEKPHATEMDSYSQWVWELQGHPNVWDKTL